MNEKQKRITILEREKKSFFSWNPNAKHERAYDDYYIVIEKKKKIQTYNHNYNCKDKIPK